MLLALLCFQQTPAAGRRYWRALLSGIEGLYCDIPSDTYNNYFINTLNVY